MCASHDVLGTTECPECCSVWCASNVVKISPRNRAAMIREQLHGYAAKRTDSGMGEKQKNDTARIAEFEIPQCVRIGFEGRGKHEKKAFAEKKSIEERTQQRPRQHS